MIRSMVLAGRNLEGLTLREMAYNWMMAAAIGTTMALSLIKVVRFGTTHPTRLCC